MTEHAGNFLIETLGTCNIDSPIQLSQIDGDFIANYVREDEYVRYTVEVQEGQTIGPIKQADVLEKAGPRKKIFFNPRHVHAVIATCGGLCPGINDVIRAVVRCLWNRYGVRRITGVRYGYKGFLPSYQYPSIELNPDVVDDIHKVGGSFLGTSRGGGKKVADIVDGIEQMNANIVFLVGGDGTQKGAHSIAEEIERRHLTASVIGIPKTIDNDLSFIHKSFGFDTAVGHAAEAVGSAHMEAHSQINGIGLVKLMGRESGFITAYTAIASHEANFVLIPEVPFGLEGNNGLLAHIKKRLEKRGHAVIVVAEGAGQHLLHDMNATDASGNKRLADIGVFLKNAIEQYFKEEDIHINLKYIDPSYQIRAAVAAPIDSIYCERLGNNAVHAAMAGKTKTIVGLVHNRFVHLPMKLVTGKRKHVDPEASLWRDVLDATGQPMLIQ